MPEAPFYYLSVGVILSTVGDTQYHGGYHDARGGYHDVCGGYHDARGDIMMHVGDIMMHVGIS